jgi:type I restriction enzyme S subunit
VSEWQERKLEDLGSLQRGRSRHRPRYDFHLYGGKYPFIQTGEVREARKYIRKFEQTYSDAGLAQSKLWPKNTLCITIAANIAELAILSFEACFPDSVLGFIPNENTDLDFVYYTLTHFQRELKHIGEGSVQDNINLGTFQDVLFPIPELEEQKAIASVLSGLDDKIDLLHRQNTTLERMAETLFRQWFVEEAQEDWQRKRIGDVLTTVLGGTPSTTKPEYWNGTVPWINSGEINKFRILEATKFISELGLKKSNAKLLPVGTTVVAITGATLGQVSLLEIETSANQSVIGIIPSERLTKEFVFLWVKLKIEEIILSETGGAQPHINKNDINNTEILIPPTDLLLEKNKIFEAWFNKITSNVFQIQTLEKLRDNLLPKLMSGEVRIS